MNSKNDAGAARDTGRTQAKSRSASAFDEKWIAGNMNGHTLVNSTSKAEVK